MKPYGLIADIHCHNWSQFATTRKDGINSRLGIIINEIGRVAAETKKAGGDTVIVAGDFFHVRGSVAPSVLNPVCDVVRHMTSKAGIRLVIVPGNHDLENAHSDRIGNATRALNTFGAQVYDGPHYDSEHGVLMMPWYHDIEILIAAIKDQKDVLVANRRDPSETDLILHAPINGTLIGVPGVGLDPADLAALGFRRVLAGHYHNHKDFGNNVFSIGAIAHHTWSDVNSSAGFLIVGDDVRYFASHAPNFIDLDPDLTDEEAEFEVDGHYVRAKLKDVTPEEVKRVRDQIMSWGAKGVVINVARTATVTRTGSTAETGKTIEASVEDHVKTMKRSDERALTETCLDILAEAKGGIE